MSVKVCYVWIDKYRNFENFGFNLSNNEEFKFNRERKTLTRSESKDIPSNFFGDNIFSVTGVVGKNGSGKSNLLELICKALKGGKTSLISDFLIVVKENDDYKCYLNFKETIVIKSNFLLGISNYQGAVKNLKVIYFSNIYDERNQSFDRRVSDLSANKRYAVRASSRKTTDFVKQLQFIRSNEFSSTEIPPPDKILVVPKYSSFTGGYWERRFISNSSLNKRIMLDLKSFYLSIKKSNQSKGKLYCFLIYTIVIEVLNLTKEIDFEANLFDHTLELETHRLIDTLETISLTYKSKIGEAERWKEWCYAVISNVYDIFKRDKRKIKKIILIESNIKLLDEFEEFIQNKNLKGIKEGTGARKTEGFVLEFKNSSRLDQRFYNFLDSNSKIYLDWLGVSSGNKAYLNLFSLLKYELNGTRDENVIICIDEGDLYLHPRWQADFFYQLINLVPLFKKMNYQFVLTSHSPFLVSDLPKQSLVFLENNSKDYSEIIERNTELKTFGGNIGELYIDAFFMDGSLISRFAANKIQYLIRKTKERFSEDDKKIFDLLGDDFVKIQIEKLIEKYDTN